MTQQLLEALSTGVPIPIYHDTSALDHRARAVMATIQLITGLIMIIGGVQLWWKNR